MTGHPAIEQAAVAALYCGMDPIRYLRHDGFDRLTVDAVLQRAAERHRDEWKQIVDAIGGKVAEVVLAAMPR